MPLGESHTASKGSNEEAPPPRRSPPRISGYKCFVPQPGAHTLGAQTTALDAPELILILKTERDIDIKGLYKGPRVRAVRRRLYPKIARTRLKICLVGDRGVGKTSLIERYAFNHHDPRYVQTVGTRVYRKRVGARLSEYKLNLVVDLDIWDVTGQKAFASLFSQAYFYGAQGVIAVCDATRKDTLFNLDHWLDTALGLRRAVRIGIAVNKSDVPKRRILPRDVDITARAYEAPYLYVSARTGENVEDLFAGLILEILRQKLPRRAPTPLPPAARVRR